MIATDSGGAYYHTNTRMEHNHTRINTHTHTRAHTLSHGTICRSHLRSSSSQIYRYTNTNPRTHTPAYAIPWIRAHSSGKIPECQQLVKAVWREITRTHIFICAPTLSLDTRQTFIHISFFWLFILRCKFYRLFAIIFFLSFESEKCIFRNASSGSVWMTFVKRETKQFHPSKSTIRKPFQSKFIRFLAILCAKKKFCIALNRPKNQNQWYFFHLNSFISSSCVSLCVFFVC